MHKPLFALALCCYLFSSCVISRDYVAASFDVNHEREGGPSKLVHPADYSENVMHEWIWGLNGVGSDPIKISSEGADGREWLPVGYVPVAQKKGKVMFASGLELVGKNSHLDDFHEHLTYLVGYQDVRYEYPLNNNARVFGGIGPYIGYGIGGKSGSGSFKVPSFGGDDGYKRFDAGLHFTGGYELPSSLNFRLNYEFGLYDKSPDPSDYTSRNRTWSVAVGYSLSKIINSFKKKK